MFSNTNNLVLDKLSLSCPCGTGHGDSRVKAGSGTGQKQPSGSAPAGTHSFLRGTVPAPVRLALPGHIPHPARQESLQPCAPPCLSASPALCPIIAVGIPVLASRLPASPIFGLSEQLVILAGCSGSYQPLLQ